MRHILFLSLFALASCVSEERSVSPRHGVVQVEIARGALTRADDNVVMNTVRLIVFTDLDATPRAEINRLYRGSAGEFTPEGDPARVKFVLKVSRKKSEKLVVAVINEPAGLSAELDAIAAPTDLDGIELEMSHFVNDNHLSLKPGAAIPMTGALWTDRLFRTETEAGQANNVLTLEVQRAVARVDVCLKRGDDVDPDLKMAAGSTVALTKTYTKSNFFHHSSAAGTIGSIPAVSSGFVDRTWEYTSTLPADIVETNLVCSFYTPEREHIANRLRLVIEILTTEGAPRRGTLTITRATDKNGVEHAVDRILRNHIYKVKVTIGRNEITGEIDDWNDENVTTDL